MKFNKLIPELSVTDVSNSTKFYQMLGFQIVYERENFVFLELEGNQIMIEKINDNWNTGELKYPFGRGINISMEVSKIDEIFNVLNEHNYPIFKEIMKNEYIVNGIKYIDKEFLVQDPDGYLLRFTE